MLEANLDARGLIFALVVSRFNGLVGERLLDGALDALRRHGAADEGLTVVRVPGSFEIPLAVNVIAASGQVNAVIALGALLRGETAHFDLIAHEVARGLGAAALVTGVPVSFGILTCDSLDQALERAGGKHGNKGAEAALAALEMARLMPALRAPARSRRQK